MRFLRGKRAPGRNILSQFANGAELRVTRASFFADHERRGPIRAVRCGRAFSGVYLGQAKRRGRRLTDGTAQQSRRARRLPHRSYCRVRAWETPRSWGPSISDGKIYRIECGGFGPWRRIRVPWWNKSVIGGLFGLTWPFAFVSLAFSTSPAS